MRIIKEVNHGAMKVSVFKMNEKISIKFEKQLNEIIIKFRDGSGMDEEKKIEDFLNDDMLNYYQGLLDEVNNSKLDQIIKLEADRGFIFPEII